MRSILWRQFINCKCNVANLFVAIVYLYLCRSFFRFKWKKNMRLYSCGKIGQQMWRLFCWLCLCCPGTEPFNFQLVDFFRFYVFEPSHSSQAMLICVSQLWELESFSTILVYYFWFDYITRALVLPNQLEIWIIVSTLFIFIFVLLVRGCGLMIWIFIVVTWWSLSKEQSEKFKDRMGYKQEDTIVMSFADFEALEVLVSSVDHYAKLVLVDKI